jgi:hypothetical protein
VAVDDTTEPGSKKAASALNLFNPQMQRIHIFCHFIHFSPQPDVIELKKQDLVSEPENRDWT